MYSLQKVKSNNIKRKIQFRLAYFVIIYFYCGLWGFNKTLGSLHLLPEGQRLFTVVHYL